MIRYIEESNWNNLLGTTIQTQSSASACLVSGYLLKYEQKMPLFEVFVSIESTTVRTSSECYVCVSPCKSLKWSFQKRAKGGPHQSEPASTLLCLAHHNRDDLQQQSLALWMVIKIWAAKKKPMLLSSSTDSWKWPCLWTTISLSKSETRIQSSKEMDKSPTFTSFLKPLSDE